MSDQPKHTNSDWLYNKYVCEQLNANQIADIARVDEKVIRHWLRKHKIHRRRIPRSYKRRRNKQAALQYKGGRCRVCTYQRCTRALEFHHVRPADKKFTISQGLEKHWPVLRKELDKCLLVCKNCHTEAHNGLVDQDHMEALLEEDLRRNGKDS